MRVVLTVLLCLSAGAAFPHGSVSMDEDMCKLRVGKYVMHFAGYQPETVSGPKEFCEDIPEVANTIIVLDYLNEELRDIPAEVRIIRDQGGEQNLDAVTVFQLPPKVYPTGSLSLETKFTEAGKYIGLVTLGGKEQAVARFPFFVGKKAKHWYWLLPALAGAVGLYFLGMHQRRRQRIAG